MQYIEQLYTEDDSTYCVNVLNSRAFLVFSRSGYSVKGRANSSSPPAQPHTQQEEQRVRSGERKRKPRSAVCLEENRCF